MNEAIIKRLEKANIKPTPMRMLVLEKMLQAQHNWSLNELEASFDRVDRVTLFRTIKTFVEKGLAHKTDVSGKAPMYALCSEECTTEEHKHFHPHYWCESCETLRCDHEVNLPVDLRFLQEDFQVDSIEILVKGICDQCGSN